MDYLVLSDTHGNRGALRAVTERLNFHPAALLFLGDGARDLPFFSARPGMADVPVIAVRGNCDSPFDPLAAGLDEERCIYLEDKKILMFHGHRLGVRAGIDRIAQTGARREADVVLFGHTHVAYETTLPAGEEVGDGLVLKKPLLIANPGSAGEPRDGFALRFGVLTIRSGVVLFSHGSVER